MKDTTFVGLDVHKETIDIAITRGRWGNIESRGKIANTPEALWKQLRTLGPKKTLLVAYEAGPCGYGIYRQLTRRGVTCVVVAPSLVPRRPGDRVKTDRRDARMLVQMLRSGDLPVIWVPDEAHEALRDLVRAREDAKVARHRLRQQLGKMLLRLGHHPPSGVTTWTVRHRHWLDQVKLEQPAQQLVLGEYIHAIDEVSQRMQRFDGKLEQLAQTCPHAPVIAALQALRGVKMLTAVTWVAELGDLTRFAHPKGLMAYAGLVPSESSSGARQYRGSITKTGNQHVRRVTVEAAWHYRHLPRVSRTLRKRQEHLPEKVKQIAWKAQDRLNWKYRRLVGRGKTKNKAIVAVARELLGFVWSIGQEVATETYITQSADIVDRTDKIVDLVQNRQG